MKLISEIIDQPLKLVIEAVEGKPTRQFLEGIHIQGAVKNRNNRIYPMQTLQREVGRYVTEHVSMNRAYGELNHPEGPNVNLDRVAIYIKNLRQEGNNFIGKSQIASTPMGDIVKGMINDGVNLGVSTRALGSLKPIAEGVNEVQDDFRLLAIDVVADPSAPDAYVNGIFEGRDYIFDSAHGKVIEKVEETYKQLKRMTMDEIERNKVRLFESWLNDIAKAA